MPTMTNNDLWSIALECQPGIFASWVLEMPIDQHFDWADGPLDAPIP